MNTSNYSKAEMERLQKEFLKQAMEMAKRSSADSKIEAAQMKAAETDASTAAEKAETPNEAHDNDTQAEIRIEEKQENENKAESTEEAADENADGEDKTNPDDGMNDAESEDKPEEGCADDSKMCGECGEDNDSFFSAACADVSDTVNMKSAKEFLADMSESAALLGQANAENTTGKSASEVPPPSFSDYIEKHNRKS